MKAGDKVVIVGPKGFANMHTLNAWNIKIGDVCTIIETFPKISAKDIREGWKGIEHKGTIYTVEHFELEVITEPKITHKETKMHIESLPRQYKLILDAQDIGVLIAALEFAGRRENTLWKDETKALVLSYAEKLSNAKKGS